ncbi:MAG: bifunctional demethylmenaquinone methyltransferase/2-methoxy-6-polyprenyl-1,4-benzoquinol methylase UbiE [Sedimentisphaerales bacterium]|nr:bifunctional demethylmenaquinone methyltransferase/2-methoxy-6-polyprenyl-1,4-benzoquinol methylase UbiE [Sedimentisphaerales bacterium]
MNQVIAKSWNRLELKNPHQSPAKSEKLKAMFSAIAPHYDLLNHILSLNMDRHWRRRAVERAQVGPGQKILDLCCGSGDLTLEFAQSLNGTGSIVGVDFVENMLSIAQNKTQIETQKDSDRYKAIYFKWICADAESVPLPGGEFDRVGCAFGLRNLKDLSAGMDEMYRLLKPGGKAIILEFSMPQNRIISWIYACYFRVLLPLMAHFLVRDPFHAYQYLPDSVKSFKSQGDLVTLLQQTGFSAVRTETLCFGAVLLMVAEKV